jgi:hypothetical protein
MLIKGKAIIKVIDSKNQKVKQVIEQPNIIPDSTLRSILNWSANPVFSGVKISISDDIVTPSKDNNILTGIIATGYVPAGVASPVVDLNSDPPFGKIQNRIDFVNFERTFYTLGLTGLGAGSNQSQLNANATAYLLLDTPCTQGATDFLDITYYVFIDNVEGQGLNGKYLQAFVEAIFGISYRNYSNRWFSGFNMEVLTSSPFNLPNLEDYPYQNFGGGALLTSFFNSSSNNVGGWSFAGRIDGLFKFKTIADWGVNNLVGTIINSLYQGTDDRASTMYAAKSLIKNQVSPIQNQFKKSAAAQLPFFDSLEIATGTGNAVITTSSSNWTGKYPHIYRVNIVNSGATGTATYKISRRKWLGFNGNKYEDVALPNPFRNTVEPATPRFHGWRNADDVLWFSSTEIAQYDDTGVTLLDLTNGAYQCWDASTTPPLPVTAARQCAVDPVNKIIYVGCRNTGIWVINTVTNTVTNPVTLKCYGIDVGKNNVAFALVEGALISSNNWGQVLNFSFAGISDNNWNKVYWLKADPEDARNCLALGARDASNNFYICWWNAASTAAVLGPKDSQIIKPWPFCFDVSDTGSFWCGCRNISNNLYDGLHRFTYGTPDMTRIANTFQAYSPPRASASHPVWGNQSFYKIAFIGNNIISSLGLVSANAIVINSFGIESATVLHLDGGITLAGNVMRQLFTDNAYCWEHYGWNGTNWELNHAGSRVAHATVEDLLDGLQVKFQDGASAPHFVAGEFFNQYVNWGLLKDNATTLYFNSAWYTKTVKFDVPVESGFVIPNSAPFQKQLQVSQEEGFITIEIDNPDLNSFFINNIPIATLYTTGTVPPGPNEIRLAANGTMTFNSADAGKTVTGTFAYVKD